MSEKVIQVALADDHRLMRVGLAQIINYQPDLNARIQAAHGKELIDQLPDHHVDVVLLDIDMPVMDGKATLDYIVKHHPGIKVIILTVHEHDSFIVNMMEAGAHGYLLKDSAPDEVLQAIRSVVEEGIYFNNRVSKALLKVLPGRSAPLKSASFGASLSQRELDVLALICEENTTKQIADKLFLSPKSIEGYRKSLLEKTGTKNVAGLAIYAVKNGLF